MSATETEIQRAILDALASVGAFAMRVQSGKVKVRGGWMQLAPAGTPDIIVLVPPRGLLLGLEVKTATGEERESQIIWRAQACRRGAVVETVRSVQEALDAYRRAQVTSERKNAS